MVYAKAPFGGPQHVLEYLGRYTHRVAISNRRLLALQDGQVSFAWKDYRDAGKSKVMTVSAEEFIRRFLQHVVPPGFQRIRYYGFLANCHRTAKLTLCRQLLATACSQLLPQPADCRDFLAALTRSQPPALPAVWERQSSSACNSSRPVTAQFRSAWTAHDALLPESARTPALPSRQGTLPVCPHRTTRCRCHTHWHAQFACRNHAPCAYRQRFAYRPVPSRGIHHLTRTALPNLKLTTLQTEQNPLKIDLPAKV